ncbi:hypothetical protein [Sodalis praecaptivus]|uniref:hypothetical protein n=1 Tax=Sodalis TaxID=84565 RepID=UPI00046D70B9|nr:hypothetical protein [Sodalis praecaptivus]
MVNIDTLRDDLLGERMGFALLVKSINFRYFPIVCRSFLSAHSLFGGLATFTLPLFFSLLCFF